MNKQYIADYPNRLLREVPTISKPEPVPGIVNAEYANRWIEWQRHMASLTTYPASWLTPEMDGKEMELDKDFVVGYEVAAKSVIEWETVTKDIYDMRPDKHRRIIALPPPAEAAKEEIDIEQLAEDCFNNMKSLNPKGGLKEFIRMAFLAGRNSLPAPSSPSPTKGESVVTIDYCDELLKEQSETFLRIIELRDKEIERLKDILTTTPARDEAVGQENNLHYFREGYKYHRGFNEKAVPYDEAAEITVLKWFSALTNNK